MAEQTVKGRFAPERCAYEDVLKREGSGGDLSSLRADIPTNGGVDEAKR